MADEFKPDRNSEDYKKLVYACATGMFFNPAGRGDEIATRAFDAADAFAKRFDELTKADGDKKPDAPPETGHRPEPGPSTPTPGSGNPGGTPIDPSSAGGAPVPNPPSNEPPPPPKGPVDAEEEGKKDEGSKGTDSKPAPTPADAPHSPQDPKPLPPGGPTEPTFPPGTDPVPNPKAPPVKSKA